jgi:hypothetical protein
VALRSNPTLLAAESDKQAAKEAFRVTDGAFVPNVLLEGRASRGYDTNAFIGRRDDVSGKIVMSWDIFRGGQDAWRRAEMAERYTEETMRHARLQRDALEAIDKAWAARTITADRIAALKRQLVAERKTIAIYRQEYEIGRRSLIDLLNAENQYFGSAVSLTSARGVIVFADYQLLAAMGFLLDYRRGEGDRPRGRGGKWRFAGMRARRLAAARPKPCLEHGEVKVMVPVCVVTGAAGLEPAGSLPRAGRPASNTCVLAPPGAGMVMPPGVESATAMVSVALERSLSPSFIV